MVRGTFSPARAWRPAVGARLARTLGSAGHSDQRLAAWAEQPRGGKAANSQQPAAATPAATDRRMRINIPAPSRLYPTIEISACINSAAKNHKDMEAPRQLAAPSRSGGNTFQPVRWAAVTSAAPPAIGHQLSRLQFVVHHLSQRGAGRGGAERGGKHLHRTARSNNALPWQASGHPRHSAA